MVDVALSDAADGITRFGNKASAFSMISETVAECPSVASAWFRA
jgi:hypothetical protein